MVGRRLLPIIVEKFDSRQFGAFGGRSTKHALVAVTRMWHKALEKRNSIRALFVDNAKASDHVDHSTVLAKMGTLNIHLCLIK
jgi:hypothetical protein